MFENLKKSNLSIKMAYANTAEPDQSEGQVQSGSTLFAFQPSILWNKCIKTKFRQKQYGTKCFGILEHLP